jgi:hypothetical protein
MAFTKMRTPYDDDTEYFSDQLSRLSRMLDLAPPTFRGRVLPCDIPEVIRWENETNIKGRTIEPTKETVVYSRMYPGWETGDRSQDGHRGGSSSLRYVLQGYIQDGYFLSPVWETQL